MPIYDISAAITPGTTPTYPGDPGLKVETWADMASGDAANVTALHFGAHTATHLDAPAHFLKDAPGLPSLALDTLIGEACLVELAADVCAIEAQHIEAQDFGGASRILFKTRNSDFWENPQGRFREDFTYIAPDAARALVSRGVRLVGIDYLSVEEIGSADFATHKLLLSAGVVIVEGLDLRAVSAGLYELICLPLKIVAGRGDGAPARAVLRTRD